MTGTGLDLSDLHDARFLSLDLDWRTGDVRLRFELDDGSSRIPMAGSPTFPAKQAGQATLMVHAAVEVRTSRRFEWGPSEHVVNATWIDDGEDSGALRIEMQSGDAFVIRGRSLDAARG